MIQKIIAESLALDVRQVENIVRSASHCYYHFRIPKRNGGRRDIYHPAKQLKLLQRWIIRKILLRLPVSPAATAYEERCSIALNAKKHARSRFLLRLDFRQFFPSLTAVDVKRILMQNASAIGGLVDNDQDTEVISKITCRYGVLTIGAPTSPFLSNRIMEPFDAHWLSFANDRGVAYTRYADDLFFSCSEPSVLQEFPVAIAAYLRQQNGPKLRLNPEKTVFSSKKGRRVITGLKVTPEHKVSLGREFKRSLRTKVYLAIHHALSPEDIASLRGLLAFAKDVEPDLLVRLQAKYGAEKMIGLIK